MFIRAIRGFSFFRLRYLQFLPADHLEGFRAFPDFHPEGVANVPVHETGSENGVFSGSQFEVQLVGRFEFSHLVDMDIGKVIRKNGHLLRFGLLGQDFLENSIFSVIAPKGSAIWRPSRRTIRAFSNSPLRSKLSASSRITFN